MLARSVQRGIEHVHGVRASGKDNVCGKGCAVDCRPRAEIVGRFVEEQKVWLLREDGEELEAAPLPSGELADALTPSGLREQKAGEEGAGFPLVLFTGAAAPGPTCHGFPHQFQDPHVARPRKPCLLVVTKDNGLAGGDLAVHERQLALEGP